MISSEISCAVPNKLHVVPEILAMRGSRNVCRRGSNGPTLLTYIVFIFCIVFFLDSAFFVQVDLNTNKSGTLSVRQRNAGGPMMAQH